MTPNQWMKGTLLAAIVLLLACCTQPEKATSSYFMRNDMAYQRTPDYMLTYCFRISFCCIMKRPSGQQCIGMVYKRLETRWV